MFTPGMHSRHSELLKPEAFENAVGPVLVWKPWGWWAENETFGSSDVEAHLCLLIGSSTASGEPSMDFKLPMCLTRSYSSTLSKVIRSASNDEQNHSISKSKMAMEKKALVLKLRSPTALTGNEILTHHKFVTHSLKCWVQPCRKTQIHRAGETDE